MAKIKFGMMMTDARGKLGGQVFSKNRSGAYVRTKVTPVNPQTSFQQESRLLLGNLSAGWSALTDEQRTKWNAAVDDWSRTNVFGDSVKPTGKNLYVQLNKVCAEAGNPLHVTPPEKQDLPVFYFDELNLGVSGGNITGGDFVTRGDTTGFKFQLRATPVVSAGTSFVKNRLRVVKYYTGGINSALDWYEDYVARFGQGGYSVNDNIVGELRVVATSGQISAPISLKANISND